MCEEAQAAATVLGLSCRGGKGRVAPGRCCSVAWPCLSGQAALRSSSSRGASTQSPGLPQTCLPFPLRCFWQLKGRCSLAKGAPQGFLRPSALTPTGEGAECSCCSQPPSLLRRSREGGGAQGCRQGWGLQNQVKSRAWGGAGIIQPLGPLTAGRDGIRLPTLSSWVTNRQD